MFGFELDDVEGIMLSLEILNVLSAEQAKEQGSTKQAQNIRKQRRLRKSG